MRKWPEYIFREPAKWNLVHQPSLLFNIHALTLSSQPPRYHQPSDYTLIREPLNDKNKI